MKHYTLNTGALIPSIGLGCWMGVPGQQGEAYEMVKAGVATGYRHFDTANGYGNEEAVGRALRESGLERGEYFVTTKLNNMDHGRVREAFEDSLAALGVEYIDLYLMHWPIATPSAPQSASFAAPSQPIGPTESPTFSETWTEMEKLLEGGKVKAIGVSNFSIKNLDTLLQTAKVVPAVNQCEAHPYLPNSALQAYCKEKGVHTTAYSPIGQGASSPLLSEPLVVSLASKYGKTAGQVLLSWGVGRGWSVVPKSSNAERMKGNLEVFELETEDAEALDALHKEEGKYRSLCDFGALPSDPPGVLMGWRIKEDLGWDYEITVREASWKTRI
ncbi:hypothetical protein JCM10207_009259 [Rhodosporidiobolus poonsookiae]